MIQNNLIPALGSFTITLCGRSEAVERRRELIPASGSFTIVLCIQSAVERQRELAEEQLDREFNYDAEDEYL